MEHLEEWLNASIEVLHMRLKYIISNFRLLSLWENTLTQLKLRDRLLRKLMKETEMMNGELSVILNPFTIIIISVWCLNLWVSLFMISSR